MAGVLYENCAAIGAFRAPSLAKQAKPADCLSVSMGQTAPVVMEAPR